MKQNKNKRFAVTGGIGSGKSSVCNMIAGLGYPVFSCDEIYKEVQTDPQYVAMLENSFGNITKNGVLDRAKLATIVFSDETQLKKLDALSHPIIMRRLYEKMEQYPVAFAEVPLLFEGGFQNDFDGVLVICRPLDQRLKAVCARDNTNREQVLLRVKNQVDYEKIIQDGHTVIYNDGDFQSLQKKVAAVLEKILL